MTTSAFVTVKNYLGPHSKHSIKGALNVGITNYKLIFTPIYTPKYFFLIE